MEIIKSPNEWQRVRKDLQSEIGFIPTMGALHLGHVQLVRQSRKKCKTTVVSIFLNPTQFNNPEDLVSYPQTLDNDLKILKDLGVNFVFLPQYETLYPDDYKYSVNEKGLSRKLCGSQRPGHFEGVLTVVMKLFQIVKPDYAFFGEKDFQQLSLIEGMVQAFFMDINIVSVPTVRSVDGLALSSRNKKLSKEGIQTANNFAKILKEAESRDDVFKKLQSEGIKVDYIEEEGGRRYGAVVIENVRLIDNVSI